MLFPLPEVDRFEGETCLTAAIPVGDDHVDKLQKYKSYAYDRQRADIAMDSQNKKR